MWHHKWMRKLGLRNGKRRPRVTLVRDSRTWALSSSPQTLQEAFTGSCSWAPRTTGNPEPANCVLRKLTTRLWELMRGVCGNQDDQRVVLPCVLGRRWGAQGTESPTSRAWLHLSLGSELHEEREWVYYVHHRGINACVQFSIIFPLL